MNQSERQPTVAIKNPCKDQTIKGTNQLTFSLVVRDNQNSYLSKSKDNVFKYYFGKSRSYPEWCLSKKLKVSGVNI